NHLKVVCDDERRPHSSAVTKNGEGRRKYHQKTSSVARTLAKPIFFVGQSFAAVAVGIDSSVAREDREQVHWSDSGTVRHH
ncbi:hypothetical protein TorRG33x02_312260, partial [Trema orientale]